MKRVLWVGILAFFAVSNLWAATETKSTSTAMKSMVSKEGAKTEKSSEASFGNLWKALTSKEVTKESLPSASISQAPAQSNAVPSVASAEKKSSTVDSLWERFKMLTSKETKSDVKVPVAAAEDFMDKSEKATSKKKFRLQARDAQLEKMATVKNSTQGVVTGADHRGLAVEYASDEETGGHEIWFNYVQKMKLVGLKDLSEIEEGDTVSVSYKETSDNRKIIDQISLILKHPNEQTELLMQEPG